jgi:AraC family transcriptional regulator
MYAVFTHRGPASTFARTAGYIYGVWLPASDYMLDARPHLAVMGPDYDPQDPEAEEEVWVPVRAQA